MLGHVTLCAVYPGYNGSMKRQAPSRQTVDLRERLSTLTAKRQEILRPALEYPRGFVLLTVRDMAKRVKSDPATLVRIVRALGFSSYREFQKHLHDLSIAFATSADPMQSPDPDHDRSPSHVVDSVMRDLKNLQAL